MCKTTKLTQDFETSWPEMAVKIEDFLVGLQDEKDSPRTQMSMLLTITSKISRFLKVMKAYIDEQRESDLVRVEENKEWFKSYTPVRKTVNSIKKYLSKIDLSKRECHYTKTPWYGKTVDEVSRYHLENGPGLIAEFGLVTTHLHTLATTLKDMKEEECVELCDMVAEKAPSYVRKSTAVALAAPSREETEQRHEELAARMARCEALLCEGFDAEWMTAFVAALCDGPKGRQVDRLMEKSASKFVHHLVGVLKQHGVLHDSKALVRALGYDSPAVDSRVRYINNGLRDVAPSVGEWVAAYMREHRMTL